MGFVYRKLVRPVLFRFKPETVHKYAKKAAVEISRSEYLLDKMSDRCCVDDERLRTNVFGLDFPNPVGLAAGYDKNGEMIDFLAALGFGYLNIGSVTAEENPGNEGRRAWRLPDDYAALNRYGLNNEGREKVCARLKGKKFPVPVVVNIAKTNDPKITGNEAIEDYLKSFGKLYSVADIIEINISCPNTSDGRTFEEPENLDKMLYHIKREEDWLICMGRRPVVIKFSPDNDYGKLDEMISVCENHGIDGYTIANASKKWEDLKTDRRILDEIREAGPSGLSGKPIKERTTRQITHVYRRTRGRKPIKGCGGIFSADDAIDKIVSGASLVELCTGLPYEGPSLPKQISKGILSYMERNGFERISDMVGIENEI